MSPLSPIPYDPNDGRENLDAPDIYRRVLRGGVFWSDRQNVRCATRSRPVARDFDFSVGFRVVVAGRP